MKGYKTPEILKMVEMPTDRKELEAIYKTLAKTADQRLVRLEQLEAADIPGYHNATKWAYKRAMSDIERWSGSGEKRFNKGMPRTIQGLESKIEDIKTFLTAPTSTKGGMTDVLIHRADTLNETFGTEYSWQEWDAFLNDELNQNLEDLLGSDSKMRVLAALEKWKANREDIKKKVEAANLKTIRTGDEMTDAMIEKAVKKYGDELADFLNQ